MTARLVVPGTFLDVRRFGAVGNGSHDDTAAVQSAVEAAAENGGTVYLPATGSPYLITDTIEILPYGASVAACVNLLADGNFANILYVGDDNKAIFHTIGWNQSITTGMRIRIEDSCSGVTCWDIDTTVPIISTSMNTFVSCNCSLGSGEHNVGWRLGHAGSGVADVSFMKWDNCVVAGGAAFGVHGQVGWLDEGSNSCNHYWFGGFGWYLEKMITNVQGPGAVAGPSGGNHFVYGMGGSHNGLDFEQAALGPNVIVGGRYEVGHQFYHSAGASATCSLTLTGVQIDAYCPPDGVMFLCERPSTIHLDNVQIRNAPGTPYTAALFTLPGWPGFRGELMVTGGAIYADDPFFTGSTDGWDVHIKGVGKIDDGWFQCPTQFGEAAPSSIDTKTAVPIWSVTPSGATTYLATTVAHGVVEGDWVHIDGIAELALGYYQVVSVPGVGGFYVAGVTTVDDTGTCQPCYTNRDGCDQHVVVGGGTVTTIALSTDSGATFTGTGLTAGIFTLRHGDVINITNSSAPTTTKIPRP